MEEPTPLLDDPDFLAELEKLDDLRPAREDRVAYYHPTLEEWANDEEIVLHPTDDSAALAADVAADTIGGWVLAVIACGGTLAGAAIAMLVFHDRIVQILASW